MFFHNHKNCTLVKEVKTNEDFWRKKIQSNVTRDIKNLELLKNKDWNVLILWECELEPRKKKSVKRELVLEKLQEEILVIKK
jgi:DNA mismatch endonuclease (patch repair protein)